VFDGQCFVRLDSRVSNMFKAGMRTTLAQRLVSIVSSVFDQTCFNRLATHFNMSMFGHQTMFDGVWSPNIYRLSRPLRFVRACACARANDAKIVRSRDAQCDTKEF